MRATAEEPDSALRRRDLPSLASMGLGIAILSQELAKHGLSLSPGDVWSLGGGRGGGLHASSAGTPPKKKKKKNNTEATRGRWHAAGALRTTEGAMDPP